MIDRELYLLCAPAAIAGLSGRLRCRMLGSVPNLAEFQTMIVSTNGNYTGPPGGAPVLRDAAGDAYQPDAPPRAGTALSISVPRGGGPPTLAATPVVGVRPSVGDPSSGGVMVSFGARAPIGNAVYLPFASDMVTYTLIPAAAVGLDFFIYRPTQRLLGVHRSEPRHGRSRRLPRQPHVSH